MKINVQQINEYLFIVYTSVFGFFKKEKKNFENLGKKRKIYFFSFWRFFKKIFFLKFFNKF
jgi:hypothetical protein